MQRFQFRCGAGHVFEAEGKYSQFDMARKCVCLGCPESAFMLVSQMAGMMLSQIATDEWSYVNHNITFTGGTSEVQHKPNEQSMQCQCEQCCGHRKRSPVTGVAEPIRRNRRVAKEVVNDALERGKRAGKEVRA